MPAAPDLSRTHALQFRFTAHIRDPEHEPAPPGIEDRRMGIYRDLVYANMESFISSNFPVIRTLYDDEAWSRFAHEFFREHQCHTPLFPEFGREFLRYLESRQQQERDDPPFLLELAHYEWAELALSLDENEIASVLHRPAGNPLSGIPVMSPLICVLAYRFPVHRIGPNFRPDVAPAEPTVLLLVRGRDDEVRFHEINALSALLIERLQTNTELSGLQCLDALLAERTRGDASALREAGIDVLRELKTREAILGTRVV
jgi:hypothetical protein